MDGSRFDDVARRLAGRGDGVVTRRSVLGAATGLLAAFAIREHGVAQVTQVQCGNRTCANAPGRCADGCVCCLYRNARGAVINSRCRPPGTCGPGETVCPPDRPTLDPVRGCVGCRSAEDCPPAVGSCNVATCTGGVCGTVPISDNTPCGAGQICCGGTCVASSASPNCGTCGSACDTSAPICSASGTCVACLTNADCSRGNPCEIGTCESGVCAYAQRPQNAICGSARRCCGGQCISNQTNANCGTCGNVCPSDSVCSSIGTCAI